MKMKQLKIQPTINSVIVSIKPNVFYKRIPIIWKYLGNVKLYRTFVILTLPMCAEKFFEAK